MIFLSYLFLKKRGMGRVKTELNEKNKYKHILDFKTLSRKKEKQSTSNLLFEELNIGLKCFNFIIERIYIYKVGAPNKAIGLIRPPLI